MWVSLTCCCSSWVWRSMSLLVLHRTLHVAERLGEAAVGVVVGARYGDGVIQGAIRHLLGGGGGGEDRRGAVRWSGESQREKRVSSSREACPTTGPPGSSWRMGHRLPGWEIRR